MSDANVIFIFLMLIINVISSSITFVANVRTKARLEAQEQEIQKLRKENEQLREKIHTLLRKD